jgi:hypothetical protein
MPLVMMALMFFLADIEDKHLKARPRVGAPAPVETEAPQPSEFA